MSTAEAEVIEVGQELTPSAGEEHAHLPATYGNTALDIEPEAFKGALDRRKTNRDALMEWVNAALVDGVDFGKIHVVKRDKCDKGKWCDNPSHFSKPSLFKPGAEKICGMLGVTVVYPNIKAYEDRAIEGEAIESIILRCHLIGPDGRVLGEGIGARNVSQDRGDLNKSLKMASKSAHIDATLRMAGLSEIFTQDIEDMKLGDGGEFAGRSATAPAKARDTEFVHNPDAKIGMGKHADEIWRDIDDGFLNWVIENVTRRPDVVKHAQAELNRRSSGGEDATNTGDDIEGYPGPRPSPDERLGSATLAKAIANATTLLELEEAYAGGSERARQSTAAYYETRQKALGG